ncbi:MAG: hypothetical protein ABMA26_18995 [Limisphaerales bacterium]
MWNCPKCNEASEDNFDSCWKCGTSRGGEAAPADLVKESPAPTHALSKTNWPLFFAILLAPALLSTLVIAVQPPIVWLLLLVTTLFGSIASGVTCAKLLARDACDEPESKSVLSLALSCLFFLTSLGLCYVGCSVSAR